MPTSEAMDSFDLFDDEALLKAEEYATQGLKSGGLALHALLPARSAPCCLRSLLLPAVAAACGRCCLRSLLLAPCGRSSDSSLDRAPRTRSCMHAAREHRVVHLHRGGLLQARLPRLLQKVLQRMRQADAGSARLLLGRAVGIRSAELHIYQPGGGVVDSQHRDAGSLLTLSVLLTPPEDFEGGRLTLAQTASARAGDVVHPQLACGDGVLFASEKRHNVTTLDSGERRTFIIELWLGATNVHNRHK